MIEWWFYAFSYIIVKMYELGFYYPVNTFSFLIRLNNKFDLYYFWIKKLIKLILSCTFHNHLLPLWSNGQKRGFSKTDPRHVLLGTSSKNPWLVGVQRFMIVQRSFRVRTALVRLHIFADRFGAGDKCRDEVITCPCLTSYAPEFNTLLSLRNKNSEAASWSKKNIGFILLK